VASAAFYPKQPRISRDYPLNLSISLGGGKETNKDSFSNGEWTRKSPAPNLPAFCCGEMWCVGEPFCSLLHTLSSLDWGHSPQKVQDLCGWPTAVVGASLESDCLRVQSKAGGKPHLRLNIATRPIANKYREGKLQRTLKREFKRAWNRLEANGWTWQWIPSIQLFVPSSPASRLQDLGVTCVRSMSAFAEDAH